MTGSKVLWLREGDVVDLVSLNDAIESLEWVLHLEGQGLALNAPKSLATWGQANSLHALSSALTSDRFCGTKTWINTPQGAIAIFALFDGQAGRLLAIIEAAALGALRTAGMAGLATKWLAAEDASDLALVGTGRQALLQVAAVIVVRPITRVRVYSPTRANQLRFAETIAGKFEVAVEAPVTLAESVSSASVVTVVTRSREPFLPASVLAHGAHVNAVGAILPANAEIHQDVLERTDLVVVDNLANVRSLSREFIDFYDYRNGWEGIELLGERIALGSRRPSMADVTLFKSVGSGLADLAVAVRAFEAAARVGAGSEIDYPVAASARWKVQRRARAEAAT